MKFKGKITCMVWLCEKDRREETNKGNVVVWSIRRHDGERHTRDRMGEQSGMGIDNSEYVDIKKKTAYARPHGRSENILKKCSYKLYTIMD